MKNANIRWVILLGALAITGIAAVQSYWVLKTWDLKEKEFHQTVAIALRRVAEDISQLNEGVLPAQGLIRQLSSNYYVVNIENTIDAAALEYYLQRELEAASLNIDFEYGIYDCATDGMVYGNYISATAVKREKQRTDLPTYDEFTYYFGVKFPTHTSYLAREIQLSILFTALMLVAVAFFIYTTMIILRQKRLSELQRDFINNMTHEFKTPISTIQISSGVLLQHPSVQSEPRLAQYARIIRDQNERLNQQVERVLQVARLDSAGFQLNLELVNLPELLKEVTESFRVKVDSLEGILHLHLPETTVESRVDRVHFLNVLYNLLDNAVKYSNGSPQIDVTLREQPGGNWSLTIQDKGIGITKDQQAKIFDQFYRVPTGNVHNVKGFGLGLYYVRRVCKAHGWQLTVDSELGQGSAFVIAGKKS